MLLCEGISLCALSEPAAFDSDPIVNVIVFLSTLGNNALLSLCKIIGIFTGTLIAFCLG